MGNNRPGGAGPQTCRVGTPTDTDKPFYGRSPTHTGPSFRRSAAPAAERGLERGKKSAVLTADPPLPGHPHPSLGGVLLALGLRYDMVLAPKIRPRGRFSLPPTNPVTDFSHFFSSLSQRLTPADPFYPPTRPLFCTGPKSRNLGGMTRLFPPLSATGISPGRWKCSYPSQSRRLNR